MTPETGELATRIVALRDQRMTWDAIARVVGKGPTYVRNLYKQATETVPPQAVVEAREEHIRLSDQAMADLIAIARDPEVSPRTRVEAWRGVSVWSDRAGRLQGLDLPIRRELTVITEDVIDAELRRLEQQVGS